MIDRAQAEATIYRVAVCAFAHYPEKAQEEPGYIVAEDVDWCLEPLKGLDTHTLRGLGRRINELITDPTADRQSFIADLTALAGT